MPRHITTTIQDGIGHVRLARPDKLNALTLDMLDDLVAAAHGLRADVAEELRVRLAARGEAQRAGL